MWAEGRWKQLLKLNSMSDEFRENQRLKLRECSRAINRWFWLGMLPSVSLALILVSRGTGFSFTEITPAFYKLPEVGPYWQTLTIATGGLWTFACACIIAAKCPSETIIRRWGDKLGWWLILSLCCLFSTLILLIAAMVLVSAIQK
jgi:hypothetical protein